MCHCAKPTWLLSVLWLEAARGLPQTPVSYDSFSRCEKQPPSNPIRPEPCERHRREMVRRGDGP